MTRRISIIFATNKQRVFGVNNRIPWQCPQDLKHFNRITTDSFVKNVMVMGRKTFESLPKKLEDRIHVVLSSNVVENADYTFKSFEDFMNHFDNIFLENQKIFLIGGAGLIESVFNKYKDSGLIENIYYSEINNDETYENEPDRVVFSKDVIDNIVNNIQSIHNMKILDSVKFYHFKFDNHEESQYLQLLKDCHEFGTKRQTRNAITYSMFNKTISFDLVKSFPLLTTKKVFMRGIFEELLFFLRGQTNSKILEEKQVNIWKPNTTQEFIDKCGLPYQEGDMGPMYGWNWKHYGTEYIDCNTDYSNKGYNQIEYVMNLLRNDPYSRRILLTTYNPASAGKGVLYPCHSLIIQFYVHKSVDESEYLVSMNMYQRSVDLACGLPFNIASNALLLHLICNTLNKEYDGSRKYSPSKLNIILGDIHIYNQHIEGIQEQIRRLPYKFPTINFKQTYSNLEDYKFEDIEIQGYNSHPAIRYEMVA